MIENRSVTVCRCGGYLFGDEFNEGLVDYFVEIRKTPKGQPVYKCKGICDTCPEKVVFNRDDSAAGLAGELALEETDINKSREEND